MLILNRNLGQQIIIDLNPIIETAVESAGGLGDIVRRSLMAALDDQDSITITLTDIRTLHNAKIGFECARLLPVHRAEVQERINESAREDIGGRTERGNP